MKNDNDLNFHGLDDPSSCRLSALTQVPDALVKSTLVSCGYISETDTIEVEWDSEPYDEREYADLCVTSRPQEVIEMPAKRVKPSPTTLWRDCPDCGTDDALTHAEDCPHFEPTYA